jgi:hypothetical protein
VFRGERGVSAKLLNLFLGGSTSNKEFVSFTREHQSSMPPLEMKDAGLIRNKAIDCNREKIVFFISSLLNMFIGSIARWSFTPDLIVTPKCYAGTCPR